MEAGWRCATAAAAAAATRSCILQWYSPWELAADADWRLICVQGLCWAALGGAPRFQCCAAPAVGVQSITHTHLQQNYHVVASARACAADLQASGGLCLSPASRGLPPGRQRGGGTPHT